MVCLPEGNKNLGNKPWLMRFQPGGADPAEPPAIIAAKVMFINLISDMQVGAPHWSTNITIEHRIFYG